MDQRRWDVRAAAIPVALLVLSFAGCARRPSGTHVSGPSPMGSESASARSQDGGDVDGSGTTRGSRGRAGATGDAAMQDATQLGLTTGAARPNPVQFSQAPGLPDIHFDFDRYEIRPEDTKTLDTNAEWLRSNPNVQLLIEGHCDDRGTNEYNTALGEHRARSARNYLIGQGIKASRISVISYGEERPLCTEQSETCWSENRRGHFLVKSR